MRFWLQTFRDQANVNKQKTQEVFLIAPEVFPMLFKHFCLVKTSTCLLTISPQCFFRKGSSPQTLRVKNKDNQFKWK